MNDETERLLDLARSHWRARILTSAAELGVFEALAGGPATAREAAAGTGADPDGMRVLLDGLVALDVLRAEAGRYSVAPALGPALTAGGPGNVVAYLRHLGRGFAAIAGMTEAVRRGPGRVPRSLHERDSEAARDFARGMDVLAARRAEDVVSRMDLGGRRVLLDVGAGSGAYAIAALGRYPDLQAVLMDRAAVVEVARERVESAGLSVRARFVAGDYLVDALPEGADAALLSAVLHQHGTERVAALLSRVGDALAPGGVLYVRDWVMDACRQAPREGAVFAAAILASTGEGRTYSGEELRELLAGAGFVGISLPGPGGKSSLIRARKPVQRQSS